MVKKDKSEYIIQAVSHALDLLEQFHGDIDELGVTELSKRLKLHKNNVFRLLATLESRGYIEQNRATENYRLGLKALELGQTFIKQMGLLRQARPILDRMVEEGNETAYVSIFKENHIVYLDVVETSLTVRVVSRVGSRLPAYCTASGKVHLAFMSDEEFEATMAEQKLAQHTPTTLVDIKKLKAELELIRTNGYAIDDEELDLGVRCIAAPIRDYTRRIVGAVSISGPSMRLEDKRMKEELIPMILHAGEDLSTRLGFPH
ncbi:IclR family transcriptional regulator [Geopsychrobacter electrodiphilus]|uniref:IclR family transcriptional regulator n=1 Tax=Geopsychrobacter electrodiphilus TaxID=225196 RepID=UPI00036E5869|nr:IclR family transcriptional regulator [Geopsychrobacter electrodiphilus]